MVEGMVEYGRMIKGVEISIMLWEREPRSDETDYGQLMIAPQPAQRGPRRRVAHRSRRSAAADIARPRARRSPATCARRASAWWPRPGARSGCSTRHP